MSDQNVARVALLEAADEIETEMGDVWGGDRIWVTTGNHIANVVADLLREMAGEHA